MTAAVDTRVPRAVRPDLRGAALQRFPARPSELSWPATDWRRDTVLNRLMSAPFVADKPNTQQIRVAGIRLLLEWLGEHPGSSWQQRWAASGAEPAGAAWRELIEAWLRTHGGWARWRRDAMSSALIVAVSADLIRPSMRWLVSDTTGHGALVRAMSQWRDGAGFARLREVCANDPGIAENAARKIAYRSAEILAAKGGALADITIGDVLQLLHTERDVQRAPGHGTSGFYRALHTMGIFGDRAPATLAQVRRMGQRTPEELIDRYQLVCRPVRDLLVDYLRERQPALDYHSLEALSYSLGKLFWSDIERHHPGIASLHLPVEVADAWKQRLRSKTTIVRDTAGHTTTIEAPRINYRHCLTPVRAFYLDLAQWALADPARWGPWVAPCPVGEDETDYRKQRLVRKSRMDTRTRERLPVLPVLRATVDRRRREAEALLRAAESVPPGETFTAAGQTLRRAIVRYPSSDRVWAEDPATGRRFDLTLQEEHAFWAYTTVEILSATGVRFEELLELSHHSLIQYRLPTTGEVVPLLQIVPSKTDQERLLVVSPELADVLSALIRRIRQPNGAVPLVRSFDRYERTWREPEPLLFQRPLRGEHQAIAPDRIRHMLNAALQHTGLTDPTTGQPLHFTPHDFRRIFITDAVLNGLPPHIAQVIAGHRDINVTMGYKAVYPDEAIQAHLAFLARRRALRPTDEYRVPTDDEWQEFLGHFERRKVSIGTCGRSFGVPCIHEHACVRCALLWPDPAQRQRLVEIRDNLKGRIAEAEREGWLGEVEGLQLSLAGAQEKLAQIDKRSRTTESTSVDLGTPSLPTKSWPSNE